MLRRWFLPIAAASMFACSGIENPFGDEEGEDKIIVADPVPLELQVTDATLSLLTIKNGDIEVPGRFETASGNMSFADDDLVRDLSGVLVVNLESWDSGLEERDASVEDVFFNVAQDPTARFVLDRVEGLPEEGLAIGHEAQGEAVGTLHLGGGTMEVRGPVKVNRTAKDVFHLDTVEPMVVSIEKLGLTERLKELMKVCNHESVADSVKVSARIKLEGACQKRGPLGRCLDDARRKGPGGKKVGGRKGPKRFRGKRGGRRGSQRNAGGSN